MGIFPEVLNSNRLFLKPQLFLESNPVNWDQPVFVEGTGISSVGGVNAFIEQREPREWFGK